LIEFMLAPFPNIRPGRMRAVEEHTRFSIENHIRAQRSCNPNRTARRLWLEVRRALVGQMLDLSRPFNHRDRSIRSGCDVE